MGARRNRGDRRLLRGRVALLALTIGSLVVPLTVAAVVGKPSPTDVTRLPLGDGHVSTSAKPGYVYACQGNPERPGGADHAGSWIAGSTFDLTAKAVVDGHVNWRGNTSFSRPSAGLVIVGNGLPRSTPTGRFPISPDDDAYAYDRNPNTIRSQSVSLTLPVRPNVATRASCLPMGLIGVALNGVAIFNALDDSHRDAVAHETQDLGEMQGRGFEPLKAEPAGLQPAPFGHSGTPARLRSVATGILGACATSTFSSSVPAPQDRRPRSTSRAAARACYSPTAPAFPGTSRVAEASPGGRSDRPRATSRPSSSESSTPSSSGSITVAAFAGRAPSP